MNKKLLHLIVPLILLLPFTGCENEQSNIMADMDTSGKGKMAIPVTVAKAELGSISSYIETTTTLEAEKRVDVVSRTSGQVIELLAEEGDVVKEGQVLLRIDDREAEAQLKSAVAKYHERTRQWERAKKEIKEGGISVETYDQVRANFETAEADMERYKLWKAYCTVRAPFDGIITSRLVHPGATLSNGQTIFTVVDTTPLLARIHLPEREMAKVRPGLHAKLELEAYPGQPFDAVIKIINPVVEPESGTFKVTLEVFDRSKRARPGMFATVYLVTETHKNVILIPKQALLIEAAVDSVFVVDGKYAYTTEIKVGFIDDTYLEVKDGVSADEYIVIVGQDGLNSGAEVKMFDQKGKVIPVPEEEEEKSDES